MQALLETLRDPGAPGMPSEVRDLFRRVLKAPTGMMLIAGPDGSGRRETIEEALSLRPEAIAAKIGDRKSADEALQWALEGRFVLGKIGADSAVAAIARLRALGAEPFLVAATLRAAIAQKRLDRLCPQCRRPVQAGSALSARLGFDPGAIVYEATGCQACGGRGRLGDALLFEAIEIDMAMRRLIGSGGDSPILAGQAFRDRPDLGGAARAMVRAGEISGEDAVRLSRAQSQ